jgi:hypothetical protein
VFETDTSLWFPPDFEFGNWFVAIFLAGDDAPDVSVHGEPDEGGVITLDVGTGSVYLNASEARDIAKALNFAADNASGDRGESARASITEG